MIGFYLEMFNKNILMEPLHLFVLNEIHFDVLTRLLAAQDERQHKERYLTRKHVV